MGTFSTLGLASPVFLETALSVVGAEEGDTLGELETQLRTGTLFAPQPEPEVSLYLPPSVPARSAFVGGGFAAMGHGKGGTATARFSSYPVFSLKNFEGRPLQEMIASALAFHRQASYLRPPGIAGLLTGRKREEMAEIQKIHRQMVFLLELSEALFPLAEKAELVRLLHGANSDIRSHLEKILAGFGFPLSDTAVAKIRIEVSKIGRHGFAPPIDLLVARKEQADRHQQEIADFLRRLVEGKIAIAVISSRELIENLPLCPAIAAEAAEEASADSPKGIVVLATYAETLADETEGINLVRAHIAHLAEYSARLKTAMTRLVTPRLMRLDPNLVYANLGPQIGGHFLQRFPHGMVAIRRERVKRTHDYISDLSRRQRQSPVEDHFPVVIAVNKNALADGEIDLNDVGDADFYCLERDQERLKAILGSRFSGALRFHPFLPFPEIEAPGVARTVGFTAAVTQARIHRSALENFVSGNGGQEDITAEGFPKRAVESTRQIHLHPTRSVRYAIKALTENLSAARGQQQAPSPWSLQRVGRIIRFLNDQAFSLETRAALADIFSYEVGSQVDPFLDEFLRKYGAEGTLQPADIAREFFTGYFTYIPWAWPIVVEEGLKRELVFGIRNRPPLGVTEVPTESREAAWRFAYAATHLMGFSEEQAALILRIASFSPRGEEKSQVGRRLVGLSLLALPTDAGAFAFLRNYKIMDDIGGAKLRYFLARLDLRSSKSEREWRFQSTLLRHSTFYPDEIKSAEEGLTAAVHDLAGSDPVGLWDLDDAVTLATYHLSENLPPAETVAALKNIAKVAQGLKRLSDHGVNGDDDPLTQEIKMLWQPSPFADTLRALVKAFSSDSLAPHLKDFLKRESANLHALQYLLIAFHLKERLGQPETQFAQLFEKEKRLFDLENGNGKIKNDKFLQYALLDLFAARLAPAVFAMEMERRVARQFAGQEAVAAVEVIPETWMESVVDFKIHLRDGRNFLAEVKTLFYDGKNFSDLLDRVRDQVRKAGWQFKQQYRSGQPISRQDHILVYIQTLASLRFTRDEMERLYAKAKHALESNGFNFVGQIRIEQENG